MKKNLKKRNILRAPTIVTVIWAPVESEMVVAGRGGTLSVHGDTDSWLDGNEAICVICVVVVGCRLFHVVTCSLDSESKKRRNTISWSIKT